MSACTDEHLCLELRVTRLPEAVLCDEGVGEDDELSHDGDEGDLGLFSCGAELVIDGLEVWIAARGGKGGHVEGAAQLRASAADMAGAGLFAAIAGDGARPAIMAACLSESAPISARPTIRATAVVVPIPGIEVRTASRRARIGSAAMRRSISASRLASDVSQARIGA